MTNNDPSRQALQWEVMIPVSGNRLIMKDLAVIFVPVPVLLALMFGVIMVLDSSKPRIGLVLLVIGIIVAVAGLFFLLTLFLLRLVYGKEYHAAFSLDEEKALYWLIKGSSRRAETAETVDRIAAGLQGDLHHGSLMARHEANKTLPWHKVTRFSAHPGQKVISLHNRWLAAMRLYCPDQETYDQALQRVRAYMPFPENKPHLQG